MCTQDGLRVVWGVHLVACMAPFLCHKAGLR
jgi:hypothetical protein